MKLRTAALALVMAATLVVSGLAPAQGTSFSVTALRWGSAVAATASRQGVVIVTEVLVSEGNSGQNPRSKPYVCVGLSDRAKRLGAAACVDAPFEMAHDLQGARAAGSVRAKVWRLHDGTVVGSTTLRYDVRWTAMTQPMPRLYGAGMACPPLPWHGLAWGGALVDVVSFGSAEGTVSSSTLGTVRFRPGTLPWHTMLVEWAGAVAHTSVPSPAPTAPLPVKPSCYGVATGGVPGPTPVVV